MNNISILINKRYGKAFPVLTESIYKETLKIPKKTFRKYLRNELQPRLDELERIAKWLNKNPKDLF
jgi:hypothetical protein